MNEQRMEDNRVMVPLRASTRNRFNVVKALLSVQTGQHHNSDETLAYLCDLYERSAVMDAVRSDQRG